MIEQYVTPSKFLNYDRAENSHLLMCFNLLQYFSVAFLNELRFFFSCVLMCPAIERVISASYSVTCFVSTPLEVIAL